MPVLVHQSPSQWRAVYWLCLPSHQGEHPSPATQWWGPAQPSLSAWLASWHGGACAWPSTVRPVILAGPRNQCGCYPLLLWLSLSFWTTLLCCPLSMEISECVCVVGGRGECCLGHLPLVTYWRQARSVWGVVKKHRFWSQTAWVQIPAVWPQTSC